MTLPQRTPPHDRLWVVLAGQLRLLSELEFIISISDEDLPIRIVWQGDGLLSADPTKTPGKIELATIKEFAPAKEYHWIPFWRPKDKQKESWRGNISYGRLCGTFKAEGHDIQVSVDIGPSVLTQTHLLAMKASLASFADELLTNADGRTRSEVGVIGGPPRSLRHFQAMLCRFLPKLLPFLRQIGRTPHEVIAVRTPQRTGVHRVPVRSAVSFDCVENRFVATAIRRWTKLLMLCASEAEYQSLLLMNFVDRPLPQGVLSSDGQRRKRCKEEASALTDRVVEARRLAMEITASVPWASEVSSREGPPRITSLLSNDPRYHAVFKTWWEIQRECVLVTPLRTASDYDAVASLLFERWSVLVIVWALIKLGWEPIGFDMIADTLTGTYDIEIRKANPWTFQKNQATLRFHYEPEFHHVKLEKKLSDPFLTALHQPAIWEQTKIQFFSIKDYRTPDYLFELILPNGHRSIVIGDAIFCPIASEYEPELVDGEPSWPSDRAKDAFEGEYKLRDKLRKVRSDYAATCFFLAPDVGAVRACSHLGFVVYPGSITSTEWVSTLETGVVPLPLLPSTSSEHIGVEDSDAVREALGALLDAAKEAVVVPIQRPNS